MAKQHIDFKLYAAGFVWVMNPGFYDKLSAGQKKVIDALQQQVGGQGGRGLGRLGDGGEGKIEDGRAHHPSSARRSSTPGGGRWRR